MHKHKIILVTVVALSLIMLFGLARAGDVYLSPYPVNPYCTDGEGGWTLEGDAGYSTSTYVSSPSSIYVHSEPEGATYGAAYQTWSEPIDGKLRFKYKSDNTANGQLELHVYIYNGSSWIKIASLETYGVTSWTAAELDVSGARGVKFYVKGPSSVNAGYTVYIDDVYVYSHKYEVEDSRGFYVVNGTQVDEYAGPSTIYSLEPLNRYDFTLKYECSPSTDVSDLTGIEFSINVYSDSVPSNPFTIFSFDELGYISFTHTLGDITYARGLIPSSSNTVYLLNDSDVMAAMTFVVNDETGSYVPGGYLVVKKGIGDELATITMERIPDTGRVVNYFIYAHKYTVELLSRDLASTFVYGDLIASSTTVEITVRAIASMTLFFSIDLSKTGWLLLVNSSNASLAFDPSLNATLTIRGASGFDLTVMKMSSLYSYQTIMSGVTISGDYALQLEGTKADIYVTFGPNSIMILYYPSSVQGEVQMPTIPQPEVEPVAVPLPPPSSSPFAPPGLHTAGAIITLGMFAGVFLALARGSRRPEVGLAIAAGITLIMGIALNMAGVYTVASIVLALAVALYLARRGVGG